MPVDRDLAPDRRDCARSLQPSRVTQRDAGIAAWTFWAAGSCCAPGHPLRRDPRSAWPPGRRTAWAWKRLV